MPALDLGGVIIQRAALFTLVALAVCATFLFFFVNRTRLGRAMQATSQDPDTARLMGINVDKIIMVAFALGAALAATRRTSRTLGNSVSVRLGQHRALSAAATATSGTSPGDRDDVSERSEP